MGLALLAACGGGGGSTDHPDAAPGSDAGSADAAIDTPPACVEPASQVLPADPNTNLAYATGMRLFSNQHAAIYFFDDTPGEKARIWDGTAWTTHQVYGAASGFFGLFGFTEIDGRATLFANIDDQTSDSGKLRYWEQLESGDFASGATIPNVAGFEARMARYTASTQVLAIAGDDQATTLQSYERNASGTWTVETVASLQTPSNLYAVGLGLLADGTSAIAAQSTSGLELYRRASGVWHPYQTLAGGNVPSARVEFPPDGAPADAPAIAVYTDPSTGHPRGLFIDRATGLPSGATDLVAQSIGFSGPNVSIAFEPDGKTGKILIVTGNNAPWLVSFENGQFTPAQELRPDLVFDGVPALFYSACGEYLLLHDTRAPTDDPGSADLILEPLASFTN
ncbi:MAG TPA: hypothetical protein VGM88_12145 [Kofleriaceae bacterium]